jgi:hypothetical protein
VAVPADVAGTAAVEAVKGLPVPGVQKPPCWVGKQFWDRFEVAPKKMVKIPAGLKMRPAWWRWDCLGTCLAVGCGDLDCGLGVCCRASLEAVADGDDLGLELDLDGEGAGSPAENCKGAVVEGLETRQAESSSAGSSLGS